MRRMSVKSAGTWSPVALEAGHRKRPPPILKRKARTAWLSVATLVMLFVFYLAGWSPFSIFDGLWDKKPVIDEAVEIKLKTDRFWAAVRAFHPSVGTPIFNHTKTLVVAAQKNVNVEWVTRDLEDVDSAIYRVDDPTAPLHPPTNKGREAMVYLTYIIDHYDKLPDVVLFFHSDRLTWHNDLMLNHDSVHMIRRLSTDRVIRKGYMNVRCEHYPGCPNWIRFDRPKKQYDLRNKPEEPFFTKELWYDLHGPDEPVPEVLSQPCSAQFAVSRDAIRRHPREKYEHMRKWLTETKFEDLLSGRVFEYSWQYIFTGKGEFCPSMSECYCDGYGVCFRDDEEFQKWWRDYELLGQFQKELWAIDHDVRQSPSKVWLVLKDTIRELQVSLNQTRSDAFERGPDLGIRARYAQSSV